MIELFQSLTRGVGNGAVYAMLALGFVIVYKSTRVISFAQPGFMLAGAVIVSYLTVQVGFFGAVLLGVVAMALLALAVERVVIRPVVGKPVFVVVIITIGIDIVVRVLVNVFIGRGTRHVGDPWGLSTVTLGGVQVQQRHLAMLLTAGVVVAVLFAFFKYSRLGLAMRATSFDQEAALAHGISASTVFALSWALAGGMAALAGVFVATGGGIEQNTWLVVLKALPAIIIGGLESLEGAVIGGVAVGVVESLAASYQSSAAPWLGANFAVISPFVLMLVVLLVRPHGLFGAREVERV